MVIYWAPYHRVLLRAKHSTMPERVPISKQPIGIVKAKSHPKKNPDSLKLTMLKGLGICTSGYKLIFRTFLWSILAHITVSAPSSELSWSSLGNTVWRWVVQGRTSGLGANVIPGWEMCMGSWLRVARKSCQARLCLGLNMSAHCAFLEFFDSLSYKNSVDEIEYGSNWHTHTKHT